MRSKVRQRTQEKQRVQPMQLHEVFTPRAIELRREVGNEMYPGRVPPFLVHMTVGELLEARSIYAELREFMPREGMLSWPQSGWKAMIEAAREAKREYAQDIAERFSQYAETCPCDVVPDELTLWFAGGAS